MSTPPDITLRLCSACSMCCNGVLFADVELKSRDPRQPLELAGIPIQQKTRRTSCINQPCSALQQNGACSVYADRPTMCRAFECRLFQRALTNEIRIPDALDLIKTAKKLAAEASLLLEQLGDTNAHLPLPRRYAAQMMAPFDLASSQKNLRLRNRLSKTMHQLTETLSHHFLT